MKLARITLVGAALVIVSPATAQAGINPFRAVERRVEQLYGPRIRDYEVVAADCYTASRRLFRCTTQSGGQ